MLLILAFCPMQLVGQMVLGYPEAYKRPPNPYGDKKDSTFINGEHLNEMDTKVGWWVVVDHDEAQSFTSAGGGTFKTKLKFGIAYYVLNEKDDWVELVDALVDGRRIVRLKEKIGWVQKKYLLLWNHSLINPVTKRNQKAILINKYEYFLDNVCGKNELANAYTSPSGEKMIEDLKISRFYFVYKKEGERYLLGLLSRLSYIDNTILLGWVNKEQIAFWNTIVALEPNFTDEAYNERKSNSALEVFGFSSAFEAEAYNKGEIDANNYIWSRDPVRPNTDVSRTDFKRFPADFMRFPLLSVGSQGENGKILPYFKSAVIDNVFLKVKCLDDKAVAISVAGEKEEGFNLKIFELDIDTINHGDYEFDRFELYTEVYFSRKPLAAKYPTFSYVSFWPEGDLRSYYYFLEKLVADLNNTKSYRQKRKKLKDAYCKMLEEFGGGYKGKDCADYNLKEILELILGVKDLGLDLDSEKWPNKPISCLLNSDCIRDEDIKTLMQGFVDSKSNLGRLLKDVYTEEFNFMRGGEYFFWIKLTDMF